MASDLCKIDVLPGQSGVQAEIDYDHVRVRFQAVRLGRDGEHRSEWSRWFPLDDCPIVLSWDAFSWGADRVQ